jgi:DNA-directed RNA polymerase specialized sigma24 family protein
LAEACPLDIESPDPSPHAALEQAEIAEQVAKAVDSLARSHRLAMELSLAGLSHKQIAAISHCTEKAARRRKEKAWGQLRIRLSKCGTSCVMDTPGQGQCPARARESTCLKYLAFQALRLRGHKG